MCKLSPEGRRPRAGNRTRYHPPPSAAQVKQKFFNKMFAFHGAKVWRGTGKKKQPAAAAPAKKGKTTKIRMPAVTESESASKSRRSKAELYYRPEAEGNRV